MDVLRRHFGVSPVVRVVGGVMCVVEGGIKDGDTDDGDDDYGDIVIQGEGEGEEEDVGQVYVGSDGLEGEEGVGGGAGVCV